VQAVKGQIMIQPAALSLLGVWVVQLAGHISGIQIDSYAFIGPQLPAAMMQAGRHS